MKSPNPQYPGPSASLIETAETTEKIERGSDAPEPAAARDIQMEYYYD
jgi:hypothetical protein